MFGLEFVAAFMKVCVQLAFAIVTAIPSYFAWNYLAPVYLGFIPDVYKVIPYWHMVALFIVCTFLGEQIQKLTPKIISVSQSNG